MSPRRALCHFLPSKERNFIVTLVKSFELRGADELILITSAQAEVIYALRPNVAAATATGLLTDDTCSQFSRTSKFNSQTSQAECNQSVVFMSLSFALKCPTKLSSVELRNLCIEICAMSNGNCASSTY